VRKRPFDDSGDFSQYWKNDEVLLDFLEVFNHSCRFATSKRVVNNLNFFFRVGLFSSFQTKENPEAPLVEMTNFRFGISCVG
jgi:hypothetical protein